MSILQFIVFFSIFTGFSNAEKNQNIYYTVHNSSSADFFYGPLYFGSKNSGSVNATIVLDLLSSYTVISSTFSENCTHKYYNISESDSAVTKHLVNLKHNQDEISGIKVYDNVCMPKGHNRHCQKKHIIQGFEFIAFQNQTSPSGDSCLGVDGYLGLGPIN